MACLKINPAEDFSNCRRTFLNIPAELMKMLIAILWLPHYGIITFSTFPVPPAPIATSSCHYSNMQAICHLNKKQESTQHFDGLPHIVF
jgi:hypothetical protein